MISPPRTCVTALSPSLASVSTFLGPRSTARQPRPRHIRNRIGKRWQRRGHLIVDEMRLCHRKQLPIATTKMINTTRERRPDAATADCARRRPPRPAEERARRAPGNPELPVGGRTGPTEIRWRTIERPPPPAPRLPLLTVELVPDQWLGHPRAAW